MMENDAPLELVGLDTEAEAVYRHLLVRSGGTVDEIVAAFGVSFEHALALLERLHHSGLVSRRSSGAFLTVDPRHALRTLVESRERQLAAVRDAAGPLGAIFDDARRSSTAEPATRTISGPEAVGDCYYRLKQAARSEICAMDRPPFLLAPNGPLDEAAVRRGVRVRVVYAAASFDAESGWQALGSLVSRGEEARVVAGATHQIGDGGPVGRDGLAELVSRQQRVPLHRSTPLLKALTELFEHYWTTAPSLSGGPDSESLPSPGPSTQGDQTRKPTDEERNLLALFAAGVKDDAIARQFGVSTRTLRRRIQDLYAELGTTNRFGAGVAAARRNWV